MNKEIPSPETFNLSDKKTLGSLKTPFPLQGLKLKIMASFASGRPKAPSISPLLNGALRFHSQTMSASAGYTPHASAELFLPTSKPLSFKGDSVCHQCLGIQKKCGKKQPPWHRWLVTAVVPKRCTSQSLSTNHWPRTATEPWKNGLSRS